MIAVPNFPPGKAPVDFTGLGDDGADIVKAVTLDLALTGKLDDPVTVETMASVFARECPGVLDQAATELDSPAWRNPDFDQPLIDAVRALVARARTIRDQMRSN